MKTVFFSTFRTRAAVYHSRVITSVSCVPSQTSDPARELLTFILKPSPYTSTRAFVSHQSYFCLLQQHV